MGQLIRLGILVSCIVCDRFSCVKTHRAKKPNKTDCENNALNILKERLAPGEIDEEEYKRLRDILRND